MCYIWLLLYIVPLVSVIDANAQRDVVNANNIKDALEDYLKVLKDTRRIQIEKAFASAFKSIASEIGKFQVTAQAAIDANSIEGMRLESRRFINNFQLPKDETLAHVKTIDGNVKQMVANLNILNSSITGMVRNTQSLRLLTGTITYA